MISEPSLTDEFYFQWHLTERCNRHCRHCYQSGEPCRELSLSDLEAVLNRMDEALFKWEKKGSLSLTGGEPFLRKEDLYSLMSSIDKRASFAFYDILTNGSLISDDEALRLKEHPKLRRIQVSLEGATPETNDAIRGIGSFKETFMAIRRLKDHGLTISVMTTISQLNYQEIPALIYLLDEEGVDTFSLDRLIPEGRGEGLRDYLLSKEELKALYEKVYQIATDRSHIRVLLYRPLFTLIAPQDPTVGALCSAGNNALTIMPEGTVYPCRRLPIPVGNVLHNGLFAIWYGSDVLWKIRNPKNLGGKCKDCEFLINCRGCRAMALFASGDYMAEEPQCWH